MNGIIITIAAGGACSDSLARRFTNDAKSETGRCLERKLRFTSHYTQRSHIRRAEE